MAARFCHLAGRQPAAMPAFATVGMAVTAHRSGNPIGWFCLGLEAVMAIEAGAWQYAAHALFFALGSLPGGLLAQWAVQIMSE